MPTEMRMVPDPSSPTGYSLQPVQRPPSSLDIARGTLSNYADILGSYLSGPILQNMQYQPQTPRNLGPILEGMGYGQTPEQIQERQRQVQNLPLPLTNQVRNAITQGLDYAGNFLMQGRAPEIGGVVRQMVEPLAQFPVTAVTDPLRAANQAQQVLDPAYAMARGLTTTRLGAEAGNPAEMAAGVTEMGLAGLSFIPGGAAVKGARAMPPARLPEIPQPRSVTMQAAAPAVQSPSRGPILDQLAGQPELLGGGLGGALGATQGETPQERAQNALLGAAGGAVGGRLARGAAIDRTKTGSNLGNVPKPVQKAQAQGYEGADIGEAQEWVSARSKGLDMSQPARMQRAQEMGFDTGTPLYHGTGFNVDAFDIAKGGTLTGAPSARKAIWLTDNPDAADLYAVRQMDDVLQEGGFYRPDLYERYKKKEITYSQMEEIMRAESVPEKPRLALRDLNEAIEKATDKRTARLFEQETERDVARLSRARNPAKESIEFFDSNAAEFGFESTPATNEIKQKFVNLVEATRTAFNYNQKYNFTKSFEGEHQFSPNEFEGAPKIIPVYVRLRNPMIVDQANNVYREQSFNDLVNEAIKAGHDGLVIRNTYDPVAMNAVAIFDPSNIRSVNAAFDPASKESANILAGVGAVGAGAAMMPREAEAQTVGSDRRPDGTKKGLGYFGEIPITFPNGDTGVATEYSTQSQAVKVDGKMIDFPTLVPTLTPDEVRMMATDIIPNRKPIPETIMQKAIAHARKRLAAGQSVYADEKKPPGQRPRG